MKSLLIIVESLSGNTLTFVDRIKTLYVGWQIKVIAPHELEYNILLLSWDKVMVGCYTWSNGKIPRETKEVVIEFRDWLMAQDLLIFGSGWSIYQNYCGAVDGLGIILNCNNKVKFELTYDADVEEEAEQILKLFMFQ